MKGEQQCSPFLLNAETKLNFCYSLNKFYK